MPHGMNVSNIGNSKKSSKAKNIIGKVKKIVAKYGLDDKSWAEAISSQYFLLCLAKQLHLEKHDYENLINKCLEPFRVTYNFDLVLDDEKILITPDETERISRCMQEEDKKDSYFLRSAKMQATNIDPQKMYQNFHFGLLIRNASAKHSEVLDKVKLLCLDKLDNEDALDTSGGWYPYRVPWITGRILISLKSIDFSEYGNAKRLNGIIEDAIDSLYQRINEDDAYWRSGVGDWVTKWESTALCLEAVYVWGSIDNDIHHREVEKILAYTCGDDQMQEWLDCEINFSEANSANTVLSAVTLASVMYRVTEQYFPEQFDNISDRIINLFDRVITTINRRGVTIVQQYCTLPQILYYVVEALRTNE